MNNFTTNDINTFSEYIEDKEKNFSDELHIPYLICSPKHLYKDSSFDKKNDALLPVIMLIKSKDGKHKFEEVMFNWSSIDFLKTYYKVEEEGNAQFLGSYEEFSDRFITEYDVKVDMDNVKELTLLEVINKYKYYTKLSDDLKMKYKNERFLFIHTDKKDYIIPAIEVLRFFYCYSNSDSLKQAIFHASGLNHLVRKCYREENTNKYNLILYNQCEMYDYKKVFYFVRDKDYQEFFHEIYYNFLKKGCISVRFPFFTAFTFSFDSYILNKDNTEHALITDILFSNMAKNLLKKNKLFVYHPNSKVKEHSTGKVDPSKDKKRYVSTPTNNFNDRLSTVAALPAKMIASSRTSSLTEDEEDNTEFMKTGTRKERGGKLKIIPIKTASLSTNKGTGKGSEKAQRVVSTNQKSEINKYPDTSLPTNNIDINNIEGFISKLKLNGIDIIEFQTYEFPNLQDRKKAISYIDKDLLIKRKYVVLTFFLDGEEYIYLDVENDKRGKSKEILLLINVSVDIAHQCVYQQVYYDNHKWLTEEDLDLENEIDYIALKHSSIDKLFNRMNERLKWGINPI
jgi:hypothetical protein